MEDKAHIDMRKVENYMRNQAYPEEILCDKGKISNFWKAYRNVSVTNRRLMYKEKRSVSFEKEVQQLIIHDGHERLGPFLKLRH